MEPGQIICIAHAHTYVRLQLLKELRISFLTIISYHSREQSSTSRGRNIFLITIALFSYFLTRKQWSRMLRALLYA